ncbi:TAXI family TRAP transporter solute-binding subunit [Thermodesulfobacteriota bacterium]
MAIAVLVEWVIDDFIQGKVDAFFFTIGAGKVREAGAKVGGLRPLSVDPSPEAMARLHKVVPQIYALEVKPSPANYGIDEPAYVGAMDFVFLTNKDLSEELIYNITKVMHGGKAEFFKTFKPLGANFSPELMAKNLPAGEYHPGAIKFYKEAGLWPPKQ